MSTSPSLTLRSGDKLPQIGLGFWKVANDRCATLVQEAVEIGYRHLDCASDYGNEAEVGDGIEAALTGGLCQREDLWVTSKLWNTNHRPENVRKACERSLSDLKIDYLDLYLIHFPIALAFVPFETRYPAGWIHDPDSEAPAMKPDPTPIADTWRAMEALQRDGLVKNIGICNFGVSLVRDLLSYAEIPPAVLQVESHPQLTQEKLLRFCHENDIAFTAFSPLGAQSYFELGMAEGAEPVLKSDVIANIAGAVGKTPAQVLLRWAVQRNGSVVPKTSNKDRLQENFAIFDFELSQDQMNAINGLNINQRYNDPGVFGEAAFNTFFPIFE